MGVTFLWFSLCHFFQPGTLKAKKTFQCGINEISKTNMEYTVNSFLLISINFSIPFTIINKSSKIMFEKLKISKDIFEKLKIIPNQVYNTSPIPWLN